MKLPYFTLTLRLLSLVAIICIEAALPRLVRAQAPGSVDASFDPGTGPDGYVSATVVQANGKLIICGEFGHVDGVIRSRIARLNPDGSFDGSFDPGIGLDDVIKCAARQADGKVIIGGRFAHFNGVARHGIVRLNADSSTVDTTFDPGSGVSPAGVVEALAIQADGKIVIGGSFQEFTGVTRNSVARLNANGSLDTGFDAALKEGGDVAAVAVQSDGKVVIGGTGGLDRLNAIDGSRDAGFRPGFSNVVYALAIQTDDKIVFGGQADQSSSVPSAIGRLNANGSLDEGFDFGSGANGDVFTVTIQADGKVVLGGAFTQINGITRNHIAQLNADGSVDTSFDPGSGANNVVDSLVLQTDGLVVIGGKFTQVNGVPRNHVARLNVDTVNGGSVSTPTGNNVTVTSGTASATFSQVASAGTTTFTPINPNSAGAPPSGFTIAPDAPAYEITTTATYTPPIEVSFTVSSVNDAVAFSKLRLLHGENGVLVDRTSRQDFNARLIYARVNSLSPFVLAMTDTAFQNPSQLLNIATRLKVLSGDNVLIGGFIITGTAPKKVIILGIGPSLAQFFSGTLANPTLELHQGDTLLQTNDDWKTDQQAEINATGLAPSNDLESAIVRTLDPGSYTAILRGKGDATGIGVVQAYDLNSAANSKFGNIATRGFVDSGDNAMIGGFIIGPTSGGSTTVVVRAIGPSLTNFGVSGALPDPTVELHDGNGATIAFNDNWADDANQGSIPQSLQPGDPHESALYRMLAPGDYTAIMRGTGSSTGIGLIEVYNVQ